VITDREAFDSGRLGLEVAAALERLFPAKIAWDSNQKLIGNRRTIELLQKGENPRMIQESGEESLREFLRLREDYLLYR
jgi:hypothetical protein